MAFAESACLRKHVYMFFGIIAFVLLFCGKTGYIIETGFESFGRISKGRTVRQVILGGYGFGAGATMAGFIPL